MAWSYYKGPYVDYSLKRLLDKNKSKKNIWSRNSIILPEFIGKRVNIHNGFNFKSIQIKEEMVGHKYGEFAPTRKRVKHKVKKK